jgi:hypothetical protein
MMNFFELINSFNHYTHRICQIKGERSPCQAKYFDFYEAVFEADKRHEE